MAVVRRIEASVVRGPVDVDRCGAGDAPAIDLANLICERGLERESAALIAGKLLRKAHGKAEVPVLAHDDCDVVCGLVRELDEVHGEADVDALFLASWTDSPAIDID